MTKAAQLATLLLLLTVMPRMACANTYLFSFTVSQLEGALLASDEAQAVADGESSAVGQEVYDSSAFYAIFVQPSAAQLTGYTFASGEVSAPTSAQYVDPYTGSLTEGNPDPWEGSTIDDPSSPSLGYSSENPCSNDCTWAYFSKEPGQQNVAVVSEANDPADNGGVDDPNNNIFTELDYQGSADDYPYLWGTTDATISELFDSDGVFSFVINTTQTLSGTYTLTGYASAIISNQSDYFGGCSSGICDGKQQTGIPFTLTNIAFIPLTTDTPEPDTLAMFAIGVALLLVGRARVEKTRKNPSSPAAPIILTKR